MRRRNEINVVQREGHDAQQHARDESQRDESQRDESRRHECVQLHDARDVRGDVHGDVCDPHGPNEGLLQHEFQRVLLRVRCVQQLGVVRDVVQPSIDKIF
ncbi:unnamed protein product [Sphagnum balticum]